MQLKLCAMHIQLEGKTLRGKVPEMLNGEFLNMNKSCAFSAPNKK
jgi:hypothetical protein